MALISICHGIHSDGEALAASLGEMLGLRVVSRDAVVAEASTKYGVSEDELVQSLRRPPSFWDQLTHKRQRFVLALAATLGDIVQHDNVVYHGIACQVLLGELQNVLKLRLIAPMGSRVRLAMNAHNVSEAQATTIIQKSDARRATWMRRMYDVDVSDDSLYDLVVNLGQMNIESATDFIGDLLKRDQYQSTPETQLALKDFALRLRVQAEITFYSYCPDTAVDVSAHDGVVGLTLAAEARPHRDAMVEFVKEIPGVLGVDTGERSASDQREVAVQTLMSAEDLMIPLERYPHIPQSVTIKEAVVAMTASSVVLADGHIIVPRYLLVLDDADRLVGVINRRHVLRGLTPQYDSMIKARKQLESQGVFNSGMMSTSLVWDALFGPAAVNAARRPVSSIMIPASVSVERKDTLGVVVSSMLQNDINVLPVTDSGRLVGVVLMSEVFDNVAEFVIESGAKPKDAG
jgi:cytidylate kinase/CBS domain-containing protein